MEHETKKEMFITFAVLVAIVVIVGGSIAFGKKSVSGAHIALTSPNTSTTSSASSSNATYKDGTYTATGGYETPGSSESVTLRVTLKNSIVTDSTIQNSGYDRTSQAYQEQFASVYKQFVVGKKLTNTNLSRVSGSSLTSQGFNAAIQDIENQATV